MRQLLVRETGNHHRAEEVKVVVMRRQARTAAVRNVRSQNRKGFGRPIWASPRDAFSAHIRHRAVASMNRQVERLLSKSQTHMPMSVGSGGGTEQPRAAWPVVSWDSSGVVSALSHWDGAQARSCLPGGVRPVRWLK